MNNRRKVKNWGRTAVKLGLLLTDPKVRSAISDTFKEHAGDISDTLSDRYNDVSDTVASKYEDVMERLESVTDRFHHRNPWPSRVGGFLVGVGVGVGVGMLFAPAPGSETREAVSDMKDRVVEKASNATSRIRNSVASMPSTGTVG